MGHLIRFIHNRDLAVENIVTAYNRMRLVMGLMRVNKTGDTLTGRLEAARCTVSKRSFLVPADQVRYPNVLCAFVLTFVYVSAPSVNSLRKMCIVSALMHGLMHRSATDARIGARI